MDPAKAWDALLAARAVMDGLRVPWWIDFGTLLGSIREGGFIRNDSDLDLATFAEGWPADGLDRFAKAGFLLVYEYGAPDWGREFAFLINGIKVDLYCYYREGDQMWTSGWAEVEPGLFHLFKYYFPAFDAPARHAWNGIDFPVPADPTRHLAAHYGPDWRIPVKKWNWALSPLNVVISKTQMSRIVHNEPPPADEDEARSQ